MNRFERGVGIVLLLGSVACSQPTGVTTSASPATSSSTTGPRPPRGPLVVTIVVDQLAAWVLSERIGSLPQTGGFARLAREGTYVREARYAHAVTDTAPGHAALYTGAPPRITGLVTNDRFDEDGRRVGALSDRDTRVISTDGKIDSPSSSAKSILVPALADALRDKSPSAYIVSLSLKDRGAIPGGGHRPDAALWLDPQGNRFVTSTAFGDSFPTWAVARTSSSALLSIEKLPWNAADSGWLSEHVGRGDAGAGEGAWPGAGSTFPHVAADANSPGVAFRSTAAADRILVDLASAALAEPRSGPTMLAISFSANDYVGHLYGPDSHEAWTELRDLDTTLGVFFGELDQRFGADGWSAVLSADHGVGRLPEVTTELGIHRKACGKADRFERPCEAGIRLETGALGATFDAAAKRAVGDGKWVLGVIDPWVYLTDAAEKHPKRETIIHALLEAAVATPGMARAIETRSLPAVCPPPTDESIEALVCRSAGPRAGAIYLVTEAGSFVDTGYSMGKGVNHGTPWLFDRSVPVLARAPGRIAAGRVLDDPRSFSTFTRTAASLLGVDAPAAAVAGTDLTRE